MGTGDGAYVLDLAGREPATLVVGIDANAASMREAARRAAAKPSRNGRPNALFVVAAAEELAEFRCSADEAVVLFPWGSLLRATIGLAPAALASIAATLKPGGALTVVLSLEDRDGMAVPAEAALCAAYAAAGLRVESIEQVAGAEIERLRSSWARRLGAGVRRTAWRVRAAAMGRGSGDDSASR